jgi:pimeloyl-ACP methyl ester carboxylesterase
MDGVLGRALRTTGKAALDRPVAGFALLSVAAAGAILGAQRIKRSDSRRPPTQGLASNEEVVRLPDGRRVAIASHGDPQGAPLFLFHGIPGSRLGLHYVDGPAKERGVRVVCPDRPGVGRSDPHPERTIPGYADDVGALADALGFERFAVLGYSGGAPYALACGAKLPERVSAVGTMAGAGPHDRPGAREGCSKSDLMLLDLSLRRPFLARLAMFGWAKVARFAPSVALKSLAEDLSEPDRRFLEGEVQQRGAAEVMGLFAEVFRQGGGGAVLEYRLHGRPWGFSFEEMSVPVHLWHDEADLVVPVHHAEDLASRLPDAKLHKLRDTGHFSIQQHYGTMLDTLLAE